MVIIAQFVEHPVELRLFTSRLSSCLRASSKLTASQSPWLFCANTSRSRSQQLRHSGVPAASAHLQLVQHRLGACVRGHIHDLQSVGPVRLVEGAQLREHRLSRSRRPESDASVHRIRCIRAKTVAVAVAVAVAFLAVWAPPGAEEEQHGALLRLRLRHNRAAAVHEHARSQSHSFISSQLKHFLAFWQWYLCR